MLLKMITLFVTRELEKSFTGFSAKLWFETGPTMEIFIFGGQHPVSMQNYKECNHHGAACQNVRVLNDNN
jgi:hypothetical protein